jgi:chromatin remodeling complex protein RSC6
MSGLTKKSVYADKLLATIMGIREGDRVSYADLTKGLHKYIKDHNLKNPQNPPEAAAPPALTASGPADVVTPDAPALARTCRECGTEIAAEAVFCDLCGARQ